MPQLVTGLWLGYDNNKETKSTSSRAVIAWSEYMAPILKELPVEQFPPKPVLKGKFNPLKALTENLKLVKPGDEETPVEDTTEETTAPTAPSQPSVSTPAPVRPAKRQDPCGSMQTNPRYVDCRFDLLDRRRSTSNP